MKQIIKEKIEKLLGQSVKSSSPCSGGCISEAFTFNTHKGESYFLKIGSGIPHMFLREEEGLKELAKAIRTPKVFHVEDDFILMEYIVPGSAKSDTFFNFGKSLAKLHKNRGSEFGLAHDNFIGSTGQINTPSMNWIDFYLEHRILFQLRLAEKKQLSTKELTEGILRLERKLPEIIGKDSKASLLHGDLWSGNYLIDTKGEALLIDPAVYYGDREAEFGMITLFGGFNQDFFSGYEEVYPLNDGWQYRNKIYQLYHLMNHLNLFGKSYYSQVLEAINFYL